MNEIANVPLGTVASFIRGITFKPDDVISRNDPEAVECMRTKNVQAELGTKDVLGIPARFVNRQEQFLREGDILVSSANSWNLLGKCSWVPELHRPTTLGGFISALRADRAKVDARYLYHWFNSSTVQEDVRNCGRQTTNISNLDLERCRQMRLPLPPIPEQRRIAAILDHAEALRTKRRQALAKLDTLTQSLFLEMFGDPNSNLRGWPICKIGDLLDSASYGTSVKSDTTGTYPVLRMNNLTSTGRMDFANLKYMELQDAEVQRWTVHSGDILFNRTNSADLVGKTAVYRAPELMAFAGYLIRLRANNLSDPEYVAAFLNSAFGKVILRGMCKSIIGMANINATELQTIRIPRPPVELQREFAAARLRIEQARTKHADAFQQCDNLFASLQHRAFRGNCNQ